MGYTPVSERKIVKTGSYVPVSQRVSSFIEGTEKAVQAKGGLNNRQRALGQMFRSKGGRVDAPQTSIKTGQELKAFTPERTPFEKVVGKIPGKTGSFIEEKIAPKLSSVRKFLFPTFSESMKTALEEDPTRDMVALEKRATELQAENFQFRISPDSLAVDPTFGVGTISKLDSKAAKALKDATKFDEAFSILTKKLGFSDDVARKVAPDFVRSNTTQEVTKTYDALKKTISNLADESKKATVTKDLKPLAQEARKYKSAEEFVKAQPKVFRGVGGAKDPNVLRDTLGEGRYFSMSEDVAKQYGKVEEASLGGLNIKQFDTINGYDDFVQPIYVKLRDSSPIWDGTRESALKIMSQAKKEANKQLAQQGFGGVSTKIHTGENLAVVFPESISKIKTKSQLTDIWERANKAKGEVKKTPKKVAPIPTLDSIQELGKRVDDLAGKPREEIKSGIEELSMQSAFLEEQLDEMPGKRLQRFESREGRIEDFGSVDLAKTPSEIKKIDERNIRLRRAAESAFEGTPLSDRFDEHDVIVEAVEEYRAMKNNLQEIKSNLKVLREESAILSKAEKASNVGMRQRRARYRALQDRYNLTDNETRKLIGGRNISTMTQSEWETAIRRAEMKGQEIEQQSRAMAQLRATIEQKDLKKIDNLRAALELPPIHQMDTKQLENFEKILDQYKPKDEFLTKRMLETIDRTSLSGVKTTREVLEVLSKETGLSVDDMPIKPTEWHRMLGDRRLARQHPFFEVLVRRKNKGFLEAEARVISITDEVDELIKKARKSKDRSLSDRFVPTDESIIQWLEADVASRSKLAKDMTKEELKAANRMNDIFKGYYNYLVQRHANQKFSRFENQYFPHVRRGFLESFKEDGVLSAFKEMRDKYRQDAFTMNILNEQTQEILPFEKWIGFAQHRTNNLIPTKNATKALESYVGALEKAKHLDQMIPEMMTYVHALSPRNFSEGGIELDQSLKKFVKEYINANKGRVPKGFFNPGGSFDVLNRSLIGLTRLLDLGFNFTTQIAAPIGENIMTLTMLKPKAYATAIKRRGTKQGRDIVKKYKNFTGRGIFEELTRSDVDIGDRFLKGAFAIYHGATRSANSLFLLGKMTDDEFAKGVISSNRLAQLKIEMSKYRAVRGMESILGRTTEATAVRQYKSWAIPPLTATVENSMELARLIRRDGKGALASDQGKELYYSVGLGATIGILFYTKYRELKDKGGERTFLEDTTFKAMRDSLSIFGAFDPTMWSGVRVADFLEDLASATLDLIILEQYKTTGKLKGPEKFKRALLPSIVKRIEKEISGEDTPKAKTGGGLSGLPKIGSDLPKLPRLPKLGQ